MVLAKIEGADGITPLHAKISTPPQNGAAADYKQDDPGRATMNKRPGKRQRQKAKQEPAEAAAASTVSTTSEIKTEARPKIDAKIGNDTKLKTDAKPKTGKNSRKSTKSKTGWILRDTGEALCSLSCTSLEPDDSTVTSASGFHVLCSYNWRNDGQVIIVPGGPPKLIQWDLPVKLLPDSGMQYIDQNAFRVPKYPFEPAFQAMAFMSPGVSLDDVDIIANRNSFRKLLDFASGRRGDPWRMDLHLVNNTLFISRREKTARQMIHGAFNTGYGHNLEKTFTQPDHGLHHSSSHHRVIRYKLGLLDCVVRFEVDAYLDSPKDEASVDVDVDEVTARIGDLKMNNTAGKDVAESDTRVLRKGVFIDSSKLVELKAKKCEKLREAVPQLWFGRTPYLVTGQHKDGVVHTLSQTDVSLQFPQWEASNQTQLQKLVGVLSWLKTTITASGDKAAALVYQEKGGPLEILKMKKETSVLPEHIIANYWARQESTTR